MGSKFYKGCKRSVFYFPDEPADVSDITQIFKKNATRTVQKVTVIRRRMQRRVWDLHRIMIQWTQIPEGTSFYVLAWTDGLLVEAGIAFSELFHNRPAPGESKTLFVSDLCRDDRRIVLTKSGNLQPPGPPRTPSGSRSSSRRHRSDGLPTATITVEYTLRAGHRLRRRGRALDGGRRSSMAIGRQCTAIDDYHNKNFKKIEPESMTNSRKSGTPQIMDLQRLRNPLADNCFLTRIDSIILHLSKFN